MLSIGLVRQQAETAVLTRCVASCQGPWRLRRPTHQRKEVCHPRVSRNRAMWKNNSREGRKHPLLLLASTAWHVPWRLWLVNTLLALLPAHLGAPYRARLYHLAGFRSIHPSAYIEGALRIRGTGNVYPRLRIGAKSALNYPVDIDLGGTVDIGAGVAVCHHVSLMTTTHAVGDANCRAGAAEYRGIRIEDGVWIGAHVVVCAGVTVGRGSVVTPGSVVMRDVPPNAVVQGNPARVVQWLDRSRTAVPPDGAVDATDAGHRTTQRADAGQGAGRDGALNVVIGEER